MENERIELEEQIERCHRLARVLVNDPMRDALEELAEAYEAKLKRRHGVSNDEGFMLREGSG